MKIFFADSLISDRTIEPSAQVKENLCFGEKVCKNTILLNLLPIVKKFQQSNLSPFSLKILLLLLFYLQI